MVNGFIDQFNFTVNKHFQTIENDNVSKGAERKNRDKESKERDLKNKKKY